jgi:hypothetical protein
VTQSEIRTRKSGRRELRSHPAVRNYMLFCLASLFLLVMCLADRGLEWWGLVPALIGCLTLLTHWSHGPPLVLVALAGLLGMSGPPSRWSYSGWSRFQTPTLMDLVLCVAVLAYVLGHYRLLSLLRYIFPADARRPRAGAQRRSADLVNAWEMALLGFALPIWVGLAVIVWTWMMEGVPPWGMPRELWRVLRLLWAVLAVLAVTGIVINYLRLATATPEESLLYLQDQCWRHTRREQSCLNRWLTWARLRAQRKKETL